MRRSLLRDGCHSSSGRSGFRCETHMPRRTLALLAICGGAFLAFLDTTIVNTSFPDVRRSFDDATPAQLSWILDGYFIVLAALLVPAGGVADRLGRRRTFL